MKSVFCHVEIPVADFERARAFYGGLFGWKFEGVPGMNYVTFDTGAPPGGGFFMPEKANPPLPMEPDRGGALNYILVDEIEATLVKAKQLGAGEVLVGKTPVADMGWFAIFRDPDGNRVAVWQEKGRQ
jgi:predicted enzyme related to lactoylglutathione lyase